MLTRAVIAVTLFLSIVGTTPAGSAPASTACAKELALLGLCDTNTGTDIVIDGTQETDGDPGDSDDDWTSPVDDSWTQPKPFDFAQCLRDWDSYTRCFRMSDEEEDEEVDTPPIPTITITDLARFAPAGSAITGEPGNVGVAGLPTNFVSTASVHSVDATLFGFPISVRFTPSAYVFSFGDGTTVTTASGGTSWSALGQPQFTPTDTSHTYRERGTYLAQADVRYTAEVDFGVGWFPIAGEVVSSGVPQEVRIFEAHTALVAHTCQQAPGSPGC